MARAKDDLKDLQEYMNERMKYYSKKSAKREDRMVRRFLNRKGNGSYSAPLERQI